ncbi:hypothetical protein QQF54_12970 [Lelliottia sp. V106_10]|uniref:hypothetical protein n=1 Tax=Lelliottia wanjuensis TaxID=3050585 RepID=UPI0025504DF0|nr:MULTISPECIES: hypothetical protein [unclassified Lelliottia]MDK9356361.1 hypothetical protein [Lelliottia sp. V106_16]MDK9374252.1 hypothetical protein [Lelliottia sp. V106_10]MDK9601522.1 hypothetical protein [Lelliottia sp. V106_5]
MKRILFGLIILVTLSPAAFYFYNFNTGLSKNNSDWGSFGSYIGGTVGVLLSSLSFCVLAFTLYATVKYNNANRKIAISTFKNEKKSLNLQIKHQRNEFNLQLVKAYTESLSNLFHKKKYYRYSHDGIQKEEIKKDEFLDEILTEFIRIGKINPKSDFPSIATCALNSFRIRYDDECVILSSIEEILINEKDSEMKRHLNTIFTSGVNTEDVFWLRMFLFDCSKGYKEKIFAHKLFNATNRILDALPEHHKKRSEPE